MFFEVRSPNPSGHETRALYAPAVSCRSDGGREPVSPGFARVRTGPEPKKRRSSSRQRILRRSTPQCPRSHLHQRQDELNVQLSFVPNHHVSAIRPSYSFLMPMLTRLQILVCMTFVTRHIWWTTAAKEFSQNMKRLDCYHCSVDWPSSNLPVSRQTILCLNYIYSEKRSSMLSV